MSNSFPSAESLAFVEQLYARYRRDPHSVGEDWQAYFASWDNGETDAAAGPSFQATSLFSPPGRACGMCPTLRHGMDQAVLQDRVDQLLRAFRVRGHQAAQIDPLGLPREDPPGLHPEHYGLTEADLNRPVSSRTLSGSAFRTLQDVLDCMRNTYCRSIGVQFMHIDELYIRHWLQERMEGTQNRLQLDREEQVRILKRLTDAVVFEQFVQKKYTGAKRFSLEGGETLLPLLDIAIEKAGEQGIGEVVIGMAHRGRLNVLANIMHKSPRQIFAEFEDKALEDMSGSGDVKYHQGYSNEWHTLAGNQVHLSLVFNPSHLEFINPVVQGKVRAVQDRKKDTGRERTMPLLIHGDAAFAGEGVVQETLNLSELDAYRTGGTLHVILNNQLGFTTPPEQGRSSAYTTDVAKMLQSPIFHVNGEDPEAVAQVVRLGMDFRREFRRDVVIDMYCYRRHGHNEGDEPTFTQPVLYAAIEQRASVLEGYLKHLLELNEITADEAQRIEEDCRSELETELTAARSEKYKPYRQKMAGVWEGFYGGPERDALDPETGVPADRIATLLQSTARVPEGFNLHKKLQKLLAHRREMAQGQRALDWAAGETLAYASLATQGYRVRMSGQDCERGTFSHRHAVWHDVSTGETHCPLQHLSPGQAPVQLYNSPLSEAAVLGFEYGYSLDCPTGLVLWEAQFGDFVNAAQVIIDQFITSAEDKWRRLNGIVLLLPHGFEGQGPEHSSARLERWLVLAAEDNIQVTNPTTPAQVFHLLRRQVLRKWRKPLVVLTPKSLLRHPQAVSPREAFTQGTFQRVLADTDAGSDVRRIVLCTGKIYYDLLQARAGREQDDIALVRVEQLYPFPVELLQKTLRGYDHAEEVVWVQEEPENMGAWPYLASRLAEWLVGRWPVRGIYRKASASPATGSHNMHEQEQQELLDAALA